MTRGELGHSRKIDMRALLALVDDQPGSTLVERAMYMFHVGARAVEQALADLAWGGYVVRQPDGGEVVALTSLGRLALTDGLAADELVSLPKRHRTFRSALRDSDHPDHGQALLDEWRREIRRR